YIDHDQRALRESREPEQRLDLDVEHVDAHSALLGGAEDVEQASAQSELPTLLYLVGAFISGVHELGRALLEIEQVADAKGERARPQRGVRNLLGQRDRTDH